MVCVCGKVKRLVGRLRSANSTIHFISYRKFLNICLINMPKTHLGLNGGRRPPLKYTTQQWYNFFYGDSTRDKSLQIYFNRVILYFQNYYSFLNKYQILGKVYEHLHIPDVCGKLNKKKFLKVLSKEKMKILKTAENDDSFSHSPYRSGISSASVSEFYLSPKSYVQSVQDITQLSTDSVSVESTNNFDCYFSSPSSVTSDNQNVISETQRTSMKDMGLSEISTLTNRSTRTEQIEINSNPTDLQIRDIMSEMLTGVNNDMNVLCKGEIFVDSKRNFIRKQSIFYEPCSKYDQGIGTSLELMNVLKDSDERSGFKILSDVPTESNSSDSPLENKWRERSLSIVEKEPDQMGQFKQQTDSTIISPSLSFSSEKDLSSTESFPTKSSICRLLIERK